ncbi:MAG: SDR family oxidoreductase [Armatimonadetes bacterium]|nr:SDR family oxidoreductase [Armatimonadota bacterium]
MSGRLQNQVAWISGAASGMGEATACLFAREGAAVALIDIQAENGRRIAEQIRTGGGRASFIECDVTREAPVRSSIEQTVEQFGGLQILVNCAGIVQVKLLHEVTEEEWDYLMAVNVKSIFFSAKHGIAHLRQNRRSYVVNVGSIGSFIGQSSTPAYITSKGAVLQLSRSIALDYAADGVRCNCVCPGITDTPLLREHLNKSPDPEATLEQRLRRVPMGIPLTPHDIAKAILYLSCEDSAGVTGTSLVVDGGYIAAAEWETTHPAPRTEGP